MLYLYKCRQIHQDENSFEGKKGSITNNDGNKSFYKQGVIKYSDGRLYEGNRINSLWNGKVNFKWKSGNKEISEMLNDNRHGPVIIYKFDREVNQYYLSNGEKIFLP